MPEQLVRIHPATGHNRVGSADRRRFAESRAESIYIILLEKRICNDVGYVAPVVIPVFTSQSAGNLLDSSGIASCSGVGYIKHIPQLRIAARIINQRDSGRTTVDISAHALVPRFKVGAGGRIGTLCVNHELFMIWIFVELSSGCQERSPVFRAVGQLFCGLFGEFGVIFVFTGHRSPPFHQNLASGQENQTPRRSSDSA